MTPPTITYGHKFTGDFYALTETHLGVAQTWTEGKLSDVLAGDITESILHGDILQIELDTDDGVGTLEEGAYTNSANLGISTTTYPKFLCRYKTSASSAGAQAKVVLEFNDATTQTIMDGSYSTTWATATGDITTGKTLDHISMFATAPVGTADDTYYVYYDFALIHKGTFTFPYVPAGGVHYELPYKTVELDVPGRDGGILQRLGMKSPLVWIEGSMDASDTADRWKDAPATSSLAVRGLYGNRLYKIVRGMEGDYREPWNWFTSDQVNCKVVPDTNPFRISTDSSEKEQRMYTLHFKQFSLSSLGEADWDELEWTL